MFNRSVAGACMLLAAILVPGWAVADSPAFVAPPGAHVVTVVAHEYRFTMPASIPAGLTTFVLKDEGRQEHHMEIMKLNDGKTIADVMAVFTHPGPPPTWMQPVGGPNTPGPGGVSNATLVLQPGHYVAFCVIPGPDGKPHVMHGMITPFTVTPSKDAPAPLPKADMTVTLRDDAFELSRPITAGHHVIEVINAGHQPHEMTMVRYPPNLGNRDLEAWVEKPHGPMPGHGAGGITDILPGERVVIQVDIKPGKYGLICFSPGRDGKPHFMHGMQREFVVR